MSEISKLELYSKRASSRWAKQQPLWIINLKYDLKNQQQMVTILPQDGKTMAQQG
jgi:hypothetical protein